MDEIRQLLRMRLKKRIITCGDFGRRCQKDGHVAIFDRTWYGRVMVERIEGFCTEEEWKRAYKEINDMGERSGKCRRGYSEILDAY